MSIQQEALAIYNKMPVGTKELVAKEMGGSKWYLPNRISNIRTPKTMLLKLAGVCYRISEEHKERTIRHNDEIQKNAINFIKKYSDEIKKK
ncbi:hypothetical protein [Aquimarina algiphila]|uniref:Uncharacterized protein n=1 Tax=Aquimarina algiphila TaxID=2047982 RepID=A0A554VL19_9FLAO|nr:hypothetical protein [Aquimarina algiphila]TSE08786.1 hypothetical protein FOF46_10810 [Aquimarina algiphila]